MESGKAGSFGFDSGVNLLGNTIFKPEPRHRANSACRFYVTVILDGIQPALAGLSYRILYKATPLPSPPIDHLSWSAAIGVARGTLR
jgi:hypothetical protein